MSKNIKATRQSSTGRNTQFTTKTGRKMNTSQFVSEIRGGKHEDYHIRIIGGKPTPCSNPDGSTRNNLG